MNSNKFSKTDLNLLKTLNVLIEEKHVGKASEKLNISRSAVSHALARLRGSFEDPLFIKTQNGLEPTRYVLELKPRLNRVLTEIEQMLTPIKFDPRSIKLEFRLVTTMYIYKTLMKRKMEEINEIAPGILFKLFLINENAWTKLENTDAELLVTYDWDNMSHSQLSDLVYQRRIAEDNLVCLLDARHPAIPNWDLAEYLKYPHLSIFTRNDPIDKYLENNNLGKRKIGFYCEHFDSQPLIMEGTEFIAVMPETMSKLAVLNNENLASVPCPVPIPPVVIRQFWHQHNHKKPYHQWIRNKLGNHTLI